ncbi:rhomboid family intramembrane serine protease [Agaribacterium sp. ZY112]|uniref:rhomboid family intramembrane serine protease n=1 Tax=Agaribacterium sp. ZY112 TaxID=3233574 RepID=UPI0035243863
MPIKLHRIKRWEPLILLAVMWAIFICNFLLPINLNHLGIQARTSSGLIGIVFAPFLHSNLVHLASNTLPFLVLGSCVRLYGRRTFWFTTIFSALGGGFLIWLFSNKGIVIGASGLVFSYLSFLIVYGIYKRSKMSITIGLFALIFYGGLFLSLLRLSPHISWIAHFAGALTGGIVAYYIAKVRLTP